MSKPVLNPDPHYDPGRVLWIDYLRSFITVLVVAHHASLAYTTFARFNPEAYILSTAPVVDNQRALGLDIFENFNDVFFMALMFLIGGIFVVRGLQKKGAFRFAKERFYRLFIPFLVAISSLMLLAYYPAFHIAHSEGNIKDYLRDFIIVEGWPPGPPWFIWVLFLFNIILAIFSRTVIPWITKAGDYLQTLKNNPGRAVLIFFVISWLLYVPASWIFGAYTWTGIGPFVFQKSRLLLYFAFFIFGCTIGYPDPSGGFFSSDAKFLRKWPHWLAGCISFYGLLVSLGLLFPHGTGPDGLGIWGDRIIYSTVYTLSTCFSCLALLSLFRKFAIRSSKVWNSLTENAYCIYLVHYIFVLWSQYTLMEIVLPAVIKFSISFIFSLGASWITSILLRKIPIVKTYV